MSSLSLSLASALNPTSKFDVSISFSAYSEVSFSTYISSAWAGVFGSELIATGRGVPGSVLFSFLGFFHRATNLLAIPYLPGLADKGVATLASSVPLSFFLVKICARKPFLADFVVVGSLSGILTSSSCRFCYKLEATGGS